MKILLAIILFLSLFTNLYSQNDKVLIKLSQPPPNKLGVGDLWNLELTNTTDKNIKVFLTGTATEEKDGLIIEGKSKVFTLKPGRSTYKYNDFSSAEVKYNNGKYKEIILSTGNAPEGSYTICVTAFDEGGTEVGRENCIMQSVQQIGSITLLSPGDGEEIDPEQPIIFSWTPLKDAKEYTLKIAEIRGDQSPEVAMIQNTTFFKKGGIRTTTLQFSKGELKFEVGMKYVWSVEPTIIMNKEFAGITIVNKFTVFGYKKDRLDSNSVMSNDLRPWEVIDKLNKRGQSFSFISHPSGYVSPYTYDGSVCDFGELETLSDYGSGDMIVWRGMSDHRFSEAELQDIFNAAKQLGLDRRSYCSNTTQYKSIIKIEFNLDIAVGLETNYGIRILCMIHYACCLSVGPQVK